MTFGYWLGASQVLWWHRPCSAANTHARTRERARKHACAGGLPHAQHPRPNPPTHPPPGAPPQRHVDATLFNYTNGLDFYYDNSAEAHKLLRLMEADGKEQIETRSMDFDVGDLYTAGQTFTPTSKPNSFRYETDDYYARSSNVYVTSIGAAGATIPVTVSIGPPAAASDDDSAALANQKRCERATPRSRRRGGGAIAQGGAARLVHACFMLHE